MKAKRVITVVLLLFVAASAVWMVVREINQNRSAAARDVTPGQSADLPKADGLQIVVYYFHGDMRCPTCMKLEGYAKESLETHFSDELASGRVIWKPINTDQNANTHFIEDYQLTSKSVIVSVRRDGREMHRENLDEIWDRVGDKQDYMEYVRGHVAQYLSEGVK